MNSQNPAQNSNRLIVLDGDAATREAVTATGYLLGFCVAQAADLAQFRESYGDIKPTVIVLDPLDPKVAGIEFFSWLAGQRSTVSLVFMSSPVAPGLVESQELALAYGLNVAFTLEKPLTEDKVLAALSPFFARTHLFTVDDLRVAFDLRQLSVHYEPQVSLTRGGWEVCGIEALLRWDHPHYGLIYPEQFLGVAESSGLINSVTDFVLQTGIAQLGAWSHAGVPLNLSVNLSPTMMGDEEFPDRLMELLRRGGVAPEQLTIETTEAAALGYPTASLALLKRLHQMRVNLALDDFGTGLSPLTQLYKYPYNELKIDRALGMEIAYSESVRTLVGALIELGHNFGLRVTCEGVDTSAALEFLQQSGCDMAQGHYVARPMHSSELARWFAGTDMWKTAAMRQLLRSA